MNDIENNEDQLLNESGLSAAERHGMITGWLCLQQGTSDNKLIEFILGTNKGSSAVLQEMIYTTRNELDKFDIPYDLIIPDEDDLLINMRGLSDWCNGFIVGIKYAGLDSLVTKSELVTEGIDAIKQISELEQSIPDDHDLEEARRNFEELREFVKVAAEGIFLELNSLLNSERDNNTIH